MEPYWLGYRFQAAGQDFQLSWGVDTDRPGGKGLGLDLEYSSRAGGLLSLATYSVDGGGAEVFREQWREYPGATFRQSTVGEWPAEIIVIPTGTRPVNSVGVLVEIDGMTVAALAASTESGIPGEDPNVLIQSELLLSVLEELRPLEDLQ